MVEDEIQTGSRTELRCRSCDQPAPELVVDLGSVPASDHFPERADPAPDPRWPLRLYLCPACHLVQLGPEGSAEPEPQMSVDSATALKHAARSVAAIMREEGLAAGQTFIELDSSHGASWSPRFKDAGLVPLPPDATAELVVDVHHLMHEKSLDRILAAHAARLSREGVLVCELLHLRPLVANSLIDTIRHGHFVYPSLLAISNAFERHGLVVTRVTEVPVYGGSLRVSGRPTASKPDIDASVPRLASIERSEGLADPETLRTFGERGMHLANTFRDHLLTCRERGLSVAAYGAPSKAAVLLALAGVNETLLPFTVDLSPAKHGRRVPGSGVPIRPLDSLIDACPQEVTILTWDIADEVTKSLRLLASGTGWNPIIHIPLPYGREDPLFT